MQSEIGKIHLSAKTINYSRMACMVFEDVLRHETDNVLVRRRFPENRVMQILTIKRRRAVYGDSRRELRR